MELIPALFLVLASFLVGYFLVNRDHNEEEKVRARLKKENHDLRRSLQTSQVAFDSLDEKFSRQTGQLNVLQQLCDDWSSSRETAERERAQLESELTSKSASIAEVEEQLRHEKEARIGIEDQLHAFGQEKLVEHAAIIEEWRNKHHETNSELTKKKIDLAATTKEKEQSVEKLHEANARIAELESEIVSSKNLIETATANASGLKQEYVSLESALKSSSDLLKKAQADTAKAVSEKEAAIAALAEIDKSKAIVEKECETHRESAASFKQELENVKSQHDSTQQQLARVTEQRNQSMDSEKATAVVVAGLKKRLDNQESTIHMLRQNQDDALENLKHELKIRTELEQKFDARVQAARDDAEAAKAEHEAAKADFENQIKGLHDQLGRQSTQYAEHSSDLRAQLNDQRDELNKQREELQQQLEGVNQQREKLNDQLEEANRERQALNLEREQLNAELGKSNQQLESLEQDRQRLSSESEAMVSELNMTRSDLKFRITKLETEAATYTESIVKLNAQREQLVHELEAARKQMQSQLKQDSETIGELQQERNDLRTELEQLHASIAPLQEQVNNHVSFKTELELSQTRMMDMERQLLQRNQESKRLKAQANELERLRQRFQDAKESQSRLQLQLDEMVSKQFAQENQRNKDHSLIRELEVKLKVSEQTIDDLRKERALVLATLADQRQSQEPDATIISFTQSMSHPTHEAEDYDQEYGGRMRRDANRGLVFTETPETCDDLKRISGIAEVLEKRLNDFGIYTFKQVIDWQPEEIEEFSRLLAFRDRIVRDDWQGQARFFYNQKRKGIRSVA